MNAPRTLGANGWSRKTVTDLHSVNIPAVTDLIARAWSADYAGHARPNFDQTLLTRFFQAEDAFAVIVFASDGAPIGFELGFPRTIRAGSQTFECCYVTAFSVCPEHRRQGVGRSVLEGVNEHVFQTRGADLIFSCFHGGHAGSPTVQSTFDAIESFAVERFHSSPLYGCSLNEFSGTSKLEAEFLTERTFEKVERASLSFNAAFETTGSFRDFYLNPNSVNDSGNLWFDLGDGASCWLTYWRLPLVHDTGPIGSCGQLQTFVHTGCDDAHLERVLDAFLAQMSELGCRAAILLDQGAIPPTVLKRSGFSADESEIAYSVRGPAAAVSAFRDVAPAYFLDFL